MKTDQNGELVAYARILDAISWLMKGAVQLRVCNDPKAHQLAKQVQAVIWELWEKRKEFSRGGNDDSKLDTHAMMISHALMNAAGHAAYGGQVEIAESLASEASSRFSWQVNPDELGK